jgi:hypothetical protein
MCSGNHLSPADTVGTVRKSTAGSSSSCRPQHDDDAVAHKLSILTATSGIQKSSGPTVLLNSVQGQSDRFIEFQGSLDRVVELRIAVEARTEAGTSLKAYLR